MFGISLAIGVSLYLGMVQEVDTGFSRWETAHGRRLPCIGDGLGEGGVFPRLGGRIGSKGFLHSAISMGFMEHGG